MEKLSLMHEIKKINGDIFRGISNRYKVMNMDITPMHAKIIMTLYKSSEPLCQKDLEGPISCNKSTMSSIISTMEKNNLLTRKACDTDSRINYLLLTDKGLEIADFLKEDRTYMEGILSEGISEQEYTTFVNVIEKIRKNLERI
jgi:DNA-binding MarR family transcriptional regulator